MKPKSKAKRTLTAAELVDVVRAAGLGGPWQERTPTESRRLDQLLAELGLEHVDLARAQAAVKRAAARERS